MYVLENILEIIGSDEQVKNVREFIKEDLEGGAYIDFNKIIAIPEELNYCRDSLGGFVHSLFFGYTPGFDYEEENDYGNDESDFGAEKFDYQKYLQNKFQKLSDSQKCDGLEKALKYQSNLEKYGGLDNYHWRMNNWGTPFNASDQWIYSYNKIGFITDEYSAIKLIIKLSEIFPQIIFNLVVTDPFVELNSLNGCDYYKEFYAICDGLYSYFNMNGYGEMIYIESSHNTKVDRLIDEYRDTKIKSAC
jgi:hypothetical protein